MINKDKKQVVFQANMAKPQVPAPVAEQLAAQVATRQSAPQQSNSPQPSSAPQVEAETSATVPAAQQQAIETELPKDKRETNNDNLRNTPIALSAIENYDELTGHINRIRLNEAIDEVISWSKKHNQFCSFLMAAIDNLHMINDAFGFQVGDEVIQGVGNRLRDGLRRHDVVGRYSTNKFGLILPRCGLDAMHATSKRLLKTVSEQSIQTSQGIIPVTISIGGVVIPQYANSAQETFSRTLEALDTTKRKASNSYFAYEHSSIREKQRRRNLAISDEIISALNERRMYLALQPIVASGTYEIAHQECLLVMKRANGEIVSAGEFMPIAEKLGLCRLIDFRVLELGIDLLQKDPTLKLTLNVSSVTTSDPEWLVAMCGHSKRDKSITERITVEITETVSINDLEETASFVASLKELGCRVAIDDFGAGYSSYKNLKLLGVDMVKIDGSFIRDVTECEADQIFLRSMVDLARNFELETVAEWVTDQKTVDFLEKAGIDYMQGYIFGKPEIVDAEIFDNQLTQTAG